MKRCAITGGRVEAAGMQELAARCGELAREGVDFVIVREKQLAAGELVELVRAVVAAGATVLVAGRVDVALAAGARGVHLSARVGELRPEQVRRVMPGALVSVSCHTLDEVVRARDGGADYVLFGPVFGKWVDGVEVVAGVGLEALREACAVGVPVFALGGVTAVNAGECLEMGASGVAGIRMFFAGE